MARRLEEQSPWWGVAILFKAGGQHSGTHQNKGRQTERLVAVAVVWGGLQRSGPGSLRGACALGRGREGLKGLETPVSNHLSARVALSLISEDRASQGERGSESFPFQALPGLQALGVLITF